MTILKKLETNLITISYLQDYTCNPRPPLEKNISQNQSRFMIERFIGENTCLIYDILHYSQCEDITGLLMLIDFQKAFNSV